jgi:hypothetical protein
MSSVVNKDRKSGITKYLRKTSNAKADSHDEKKKRNISTD